MSKTNDTEEEYSVEKVLNRRVRNGKVSPIPALMESLGRVMPTEYWPGPGGGRDNLMAQREVHVFSLTFLLLFGPKQFGEKCQKQNWDFSICEAHRSVLCEVRDATNIFANLDSDALSICSGIKGHSNHHTNMCTTK